MTTEDRYDLVVVGGGIVGTAIVDEFVRTRPGHSVCLLDRGRLGAGTSSWSAGLSFPVARTPATRPMVARSELGYRHWWERHPRTVADVPLLWVVRRDEVDGLVSALVDDIPRPVTDAERDLIRHCYPGFTVADDEVVLASERPGFVVRARALVEDMALHLGATGAVAIREGVRADAVHETPASDGTRWRVRCSDGRSLAAEHLAVATGSWAVGEPLLDAAVPAGHRVKKVAALELALCPESSWPCVVLWSEDAFLLPLVHEGCVLFSFHSETWDVRPDEDLVLDEADRAAALSVLGQRGRQLAERHRGARVSCDAYSPFGVPMIEEHPGAVRAGACSGSGVRLAPGIAAVAVESLARSLGPARADNRPTRPDTTTRTRERHG